MQEKEDLKYVSSLCFKRATFCFLLFAAFYNFSDVN